MNTYLKPIVEEFKSRRENWGEDGATHTETETTVVDLREWATTQAMINAAHGGNPEWQGWLNLSTAEKNAIVKEARKSQLNKFPQVGDKVLVTEEGVYGEVIQVLSDGDVQISFEDGEEGSYGVGEIEKA